MNCEYFHTKKNYITFINMLVELSATIRRRDVRKLAAAAFLKSEAIQ